jgi:hypothetical protein
MILPMASNHQSGQKQDIRTYTELQKHMHNALREQHPEWIGPDGDCSAYDLYEKRFADLLASFAEKKRYLGGLLQS